MHCKQVINFGLHIEKGENAKVKKLWNKNVIKSKIQWVIEKILKMSFIKVSNSSRHNRNISYHKNYTSYFYPFHLYVCFFTNISNFL